MHENSVDPVQYAWLRCNRGISLPSLLARSAYRDPIVARADGRLAAAARATHSGILQQRAAQYVRRTYKALRTK